MKYLDSSRDKEVGEDGLDLGLAGLEVITAQEDIFLFRQFHDARHEGVLGRAIDIGALEGKKTKDKCGTVPPPVAWLKISCKFKSAKKPDSE